MSRGPAITATILALALINIGAAAAIVATMGSPTLGPAWVGLALIAVGVASAVVAISLWRQYLLHLRRAADARNG